MLTLTFTLLATLSSPQPQEPTVDLALPIAPTQLLMSDDDGGGDGDDATTFTGRYGGIVVWNGDWTYFECGGKLVRIRTANIPRGGMPPIGSTITLTGVTKAPDGVGTHDLECTGVQ